MCSRAWLRGTTVSSSFSTKYQTIGFDMNQDRVDALMKGHDDNS